MRKETAKRRRGKAGCERRAPALEFFVIIEGGFWTAQLVFLE